MNEYKRMSCSTSLFLEKNYLGRKEGNDYRKEKNKIEIENRKRKGAERLYRLPMLNAVDCRSNREPKQQWKHDMLGSSRSI